MEGKSAYLARKHPIFLHKHIVLAEYVNSGLHILFIFVYCLFFFSFFVPSDQGPLLP